MPFLQRGHSENPQGLALDDGDRVWMYEDLCHEAQEMAGRLRTLGVGPGVLVALDGEMEGVLVAALHAVWKAGGVVAPLNPRWTERERRQALDLLNPGILLLGEGAGTEVGWAGLPADLMVVHLGGRADPATPCLEAIRPSSIPDPTPQDRTEAARILTSGTAGVRKGVGVTLGNLRSMAQGSEERLALRPSDRWLGSLSIAHVGGLAAVTRAAYLGSGLVLRGPFDVASFLSLVEGNAITHASLVPTMLHQVLEARGSRPYSGSLRCLLIGGAPCPESLIESALRVGFPIALTYGLTEACSQVATASPDLVRRKPGTVGPPLPGLEVELSADGEVLVRGPSVAPRFAGEDGWLHTGDLASIDSEGHLWITGRKSDRIISGGINVDPGEVERLLETHPQVDEAAVVGIPDAEWGERVVAAVVSARNALDFLVELDGFSRATLSAAQRPRAFRVLAELPRNRNGKVDRVRIRGLFQ